MYDWKGISIALKKYSIARTVEITGSLGEEKANAETQGCCAWRMRINLMCDTGIKNACSQINCDAFTFREEK
jgi:hypothetical protein